MLNQLQAGDWLMLIIAACSFIAWMAHVSIYLGRILGKFERIEKTADDHERRLKHHSDTIADLKTRVVLLEEA